MSVMSSLFFILLCFSSMHANSEARYIGLGRSNKGFRALFRYPDKGHFLVVEKFRLGMDSSTKGLVIVQRDDDLAAEQKGTHGGAVFSSSATTTTTKGMKDYSRTSSTTKSDVVPDVKPHVSASWSVAHKIESRDKITNHGDKSSSNPGLYSDYSRPRTRPPSHN
ncbi:uncharacterized protein LOC126803186 [Argentina anserina]|uniref:uncharacterized protein LOC126803186 n=1 Tax=Argentina anserina TaxID=57926 RepID=UPI002176717F|nr:uncharacterized protein LOC126803186 [Potentilla anserina]XP_050386911.1 uncharacterized protein LOC126803186 [Potentilla anserina]